MNAPKRLKLERYADVLAHLAHLRDPAEEILERLGVDLAVWDAAEKEFGVALSNAARHGQRDLATNFASTFARTRRRLIEEKVTFESLPPAVVDRKPPPDPREEKSVVGAPSYLVEDRLRQAAAAYPTAPAPSQSNPVQQAPAGYPAAPAPQAQSPAGQQPRATQDASAVPNFTIMQAGPMLQDVDTLPFVPAPKELVRPSSSVPDYVPTGTTAPSNESPMSLPFVAQRAAKEETKLKPEQIDISLFPLELYAEISGGLARGPRPVLPGARVARARSPRRRARGARLGHPPRVEGLVISVDYIDSLILTNLADPCGAVTRYAETKSSPPDGDPKAGSTAISLSGQPIPKFFRDELPGKSFSGQQGRVILPQLWGLPPMVNEQGKVEPTYAKVGNVLAWNDSYLRSDIRMEGAVPPRFTEEW